VLVVERYGLSKPSGFSIPAQQKPLNKITGMLVKAQPYPLVRTKETGRRLEPEDQVGNPILWMNSAEVPSKARGADYPAKGYAEFRNDANMLVQGLEIAINDALDDLYTLMSNEVLAPPPPSGTTEGKTSKKAR